MFNIATGEDDEHPLGGDIGQQSAAPVNPMPPPPAQAPGPEMIPPVPMNNAPMPPSPGVMPAPVPQVAPYAAPPVPPVPVSRVVTPAESANLGAIDRNAAARMATAQDQGNVNAAATAEKVKAADAQNEDAQKFLQERTRIADDAAKRIQERTQQANADYEEFKKFGIKDPQASDNFATRILKAISVGLGGYAAGINGGPNQALTIITEANKDNIARQKAQQEKLFQVAQRSGKDVEQARQDRDDEFKQLDLKHSAMLESSAAMLRSELARIGIPQDQINANKDVQGIEREALGLREKTLSDIRDDETSLARAEISAAGRRKKAAGGGGGGGGNMQRFAEAAGKLQPGEQIPGELVALGARAGLKPNQIAAEVDRYRASGNKAQGSVDKADEAAVKTYVAPHVRSSDELKRRIEALKSAEAGAMNPKSSYGEVISALEQGIAADAGAGVRGVSMGQLHSIIPNLVSAEGKISNLVSNNWDGTAGEEFRKATLRFIQRAQKERYAQMQEKGDAVEKELAATPFGQRNPDFAKRSRDRLYPQASAEGGAAAPRKLKASDVEAVQWANRNPKDPRAKAILEANGL